MQGNMADVDKFAAAILQHESSTRYFSSNAFQTSIKDMKIKWSKMPSTLEDIAITYIVKNIKKLHHQQKPRFILPKVLQGKFLLAFHGNLDNYISELASGLLLLLNEDIMEFDYSTFFPNNSSMQDKIFKRMLINCPKVETVEVTKMVWEDESIPHREHLDDLFPIMANKWKNLALLSFKAEVDNGTVQERFSSVHRSLVHAVCANLPNLRELKMNVDYQDFSLQEVQMLSKMQYLLSLNLTFCYKPNPTKKELSIVVQTAGKLPNLKKFAFDFKDSLKWPTYYAYFVEEYKWRYPAKKITIESLWLSNRDLSKPWPESLAVDELNLRELPSISNILAMSSPVKRLHLHELHPKHIYMLVDKFGPEGLAELDFQCIKYRVESGLDLFKVLSACPKLELFNIRIPSDLLLRSSISQVTPAYFKNCRKLGLCCSGQFVDEVDPDIVHLYKMFLLGSEQKLDSLDLLCPSHMNAIESILDGESTTCLFSELLSVSFLHISRYKLLLHQAFRIVLKLYKHSSCLKIVHVRREEAPFFISEIPKWFCKVMEAFDLTLICDK